ncbi:MAG: SsrA-binding protein SmpB [Proteobacteria bacterium]|nr:SsrA-binding protein SmpB [Pseudomonadota bacterium]
MVKEKDKANSKQKVVCRNRRARHNYHIESTMEAGLVLVGTEVKSLRQGQADLVDSYAAFQDGELFLVGTHIAVYNKASHFNHEPRRLRKLLLKKRVINRLGIKIRERGYTLVPLEIYFKEGWAKVLLGLAKGRKQYDNRENIRRKQERRELREVARIGKRQ